MHGTLRELKHVGFFELALPSVYVCARPSTSEHVGNYWSRHFAEFRQTERISYFYLDT